MLPHDPPPARSFRRFAAMFYDSLLLFAWLMLAALPVVLYVGPDSPFLKSPVYSLYLYSAGFVFFGFSWVHGGQTLGMKSWRLRLVMDDGRPLDWQAALYRYLAATVSLLLLGIGFWAIFFNKQKLAWHDQLTRTRVIRWQIPAMD